MKMLPGMFLCTNKHTAAECAGDTLPTRWMQEMLASGNTWPCKWDDDSRFFDFACRNPDCEADGNFRMNALGINQGTSG